MTTTKKAVQSSVQGARGHEGDPRGKDAELAGRKAAIDQLPESFVEGRMCKASSEATDTDVLYQEIGWLKVELDWLKKVGMLD